MGVKLGTVISSEGPSRVPRIYVRGLEAKGGESEADIAWPGLAEWGAFSFKHVKTC